MSALLDTLLEMGFEKEKAEKALAATGNSNIENAMEWLITHAEDPPEGQIASSDGGDNIVDDCKTEGNVPPSEDSAAALQARSIKCDDCGKLFDRDVDVEAHAAKTQHTNFSESTEEKKPLTDQEKQDQLARIEERLKQVRQEKADKQKREAISKEKQRREDGQKMLEMKEKMKDKDMLKAIEERKREKREELEARRKIKEQIERDKEARRKKFQYGSEPPVSNDVQQSSPVVPTPSPTYAPKKDYDKARLQIRLANGQALTQEFNANESLAAVRLYVELQRTDDKDSPFSLMTSFPRRVFSDDDMEKPLNVLGLVPTAVLMVTKAATQGTGV